ncbi:hypothetical protein AB4144_07450 [Rhizobiaceae sp. 2RAB30]
MQSSGRVCRNSEETIRVALVVVVLGAFPEFQSFPMLEAMLFVLSPMKGVMDSSAETAIYVIVI